MPSLLFLYCSFAVGTEGGWWFVCSSYSVVVVEQCFLVIKSFPFTLSITLTSDRFGLSVLKQNIKYTSGWLFDESGFVQTGMSPVLIN